MLATSVRKALAKENVPSSLAKAAHYLAGSDPTAVVEEEAEAELSPREIELQQLVARIRNGEDSGMEDLYKIFAKGIRFYLCRHLGMQDLDDRIHDTLLMVVKAIRSGSLRDPTRLIGFVRTVARRQISAQIDELVHRRRDTLDWDLGLRVADLRRNPEERAALQQKVELMLGVLNELSPPDRAILSRFYLNEQSQDGICQDMNLNATQFRLLKSRAKARFGALGKLRLQQRHMSSVSMRIAAACTVKSTK